MPETRADLSARLETASAEDLVEYLQEDNAVQAKDMTKWLGRAFQLAKSTAAASELMSYAEALLDAGYDSTMSLRGLTAAEMVSEGIKKGHATPIMARRKHANVDDGVAACIDKIMQGDPGLDTTAKINA